MSYPPLHRRNNRKKKFIKLLIFVVLFYVCHVGYQQYIKFTSIDDEAINEHSILKEKTFSKDVQELKTKSGLNVWLIEDHEIPIVSLSFSFERAGYAYEPENRLGLTSLASEILKLGTKKYNRREISDIFDLNGIKIDFAHGLETFEGSLVTPKKNSDKAVALLAEILTAPRLDENDLKLLKVQAIESLKLAEEHPQHHLNKAFRKEIYGTHPYSRDADGTAETLSAITADDIAKFVRTDLAHDNLIVGIAGDVTAQEATEIVDKIFSNLAEKSVNTELEAPQLNLTSQDIFIPYDSAQVMTTFVAKGTERLAKDFYPLYVANHIFGGGGLGSRLSKEAREKYGLTYGIYTWLTADEKTPLIVGSFSTTPDNFEKMIEIVNQQWDNFSENGVSEEEFEVTKEYLLASYNLRFDSTAGLADMLVSMQRLKLGADFLQKRNDYIRALTLQDVNFAAAQYFERIPRLISVGNIINSQETDKGEK